MIESFKPTDPSMKFVKRFSIRKKEDIQLFAKGIWSPTVRDWRDIIEDYIHISRIRLDSKFSMFKLQVWILMDIINFVQTIDQCKEELKRLDKQKGEKDAPKDLEERIEDIRSDIFSQEFLLVALKEIVDGIVWRYFKYNRAFLYVLADKGPSGPVRANPGLVNSMYEFGHVFNQPGELAILNDITNFLKIGDITTIKEDGTIELVEVKSGKGRNSRITRQKERMQEIVEFFNTGIAEYDNQKARISLSPVKQRNFLLLLLDLIQSTKARGYHSEMIGNYMIIECVDPTKISDIKIALDYFDKRHASVKQQWEKNTDIVISAFATDKLGFSKNLAPFTIFPFSDEICTDIICGGIMINMRLNYSEIIRIFRSEGWETIDSIFFKKPEEVEKMDRYNTYTMTVKKGGLTIAVPPAMLGRLHFEFLSPKVLIEEFERMHREGFQECSLTLTNYIDEQRIWL